MGDGQKQNSCSFDTSVHNPLQRDLRKTHSFFLGADSGAGSSSLFLTDVVWFLFFLDWVGIEEEDVVLLVVDFVLDEELDEEPPEVLDLPVELL